MITCWLVIYHKLRGNKRWDLLDKCEIVMVFIIGQGAIVDAAKPLEFSH